ncbi:Aft1 HRA domain-containing protein [Aspergillus crustosus]
MSAAVASAVSTTLTSHPTARSSPMDAKRASMKIDNDAPSDLKEQKPDGEPQNSLAPPPRPNASAPTDTPDYFNSLHNPFALEPNPFEQSFSGSGETPGKSILPPVASITSPALPGTSSAGGAYNWSNSLRSGPLSPAMLAGPSGGSDYFDSIGRGFPTPNESSLRTGLTPGGGGSMFPAPSPNSQALIQQLQSGGATPSTIEFHRTALNVAATKRNSIAPTSNPTIDPEQAPQSISTTMDIKTAQPAAVDPFGHHDAADAANGLFMLAKGGQPTANQFAAVQNQSAIPPQNLQTNELLRDANANGRQSIHVNGVVAREHSDDISDVQSEQAKPARGRGKRNASSKATNTAGNRRKLEESNHGSNKRAKLNTGSVSTESPSEGESGDDQPSSKKKPGESKKMTDEEKRKNFLERNRVAALKCRQRKKQWLANLQAKVELFTSENDALTTTVTQLREEIVNLKTLLLAHKDCPVSQAQGLIWNPNPPYS